MNKKSNIIIGLGLVVVVGGLVLGMTLFSKGGQGKVPTSANQPANVVAAPAVSGGGSQLEVQSASSSLVSGGVFVASKQGKKYFPVNCGSAKTIKEQNRVFFETEDQAKAAGYERTTACK